VVFPAVIGAGKIFGLDAPQMAGAMGIAGFAATVPTGGRWNRPNWNHLKYNPYAFMAESGTLAAVLTKNGFTGDPDVFDGDVSELKANWWQMAGCIAAHPEDAVRGLGERWLMRDMSFKPYPSCRFTHGPLGLFEQIVAEHKLGADDIEQVDIYANQMMFAYKMDRPDIGGESDCQFSMPHLIAMSVLGVTAGPKWVAPEYWDHPAVNALKAKVRCLPYEAADQAMVQQLIAGRWEKNPARVRVKARGQVFEAKADYSPGDPFDPAMAMDDERLQKKFRNFTQQGLAASNIDRSIETVMTLDSFTSLASLANCLH
jgi:2-methylcitrate dehydratase PrpD